MWSWPAVAGSNGSSCGDIVHCRQIPTCNPALSTLVHSGSQLTIPHHVDRVVNSHCLVGSAELLRHQLIRAAVDTHLGINTPAQRWSIGSALEKLCLCNKELPTNWGGKRLADEGCAASVKGRYIAYTTE